MLEVGMTYYMAGFVALQNYKINESVNAFDL